MKSARARCEIYPGIWLPKPLRTPAMTVADDPLDSVMKLEPISLAFLDLLESLLPEERAVFLLRAVFDYEYSAIADFLQKLEAACRQIFSRAQKHLKLANLSPAVPATTGWPGRWSTGRIISASMWRRYVIC